MKNLFSTLFLTVATMTAMAQSQQTLLLENWKFQKGAANGAEAAVFDDSKWQNVSIPHDWAIAGPFDKDIDKQVVAIVQNGEQEATEKTGRSGSLPWIGEGWYRTNITVPEGYRYAELIFDGAMAEPHVWVNGKDVGYWAYGYNVFSLDITEAIENGKPGTYPVAVHLENIEESSRWYPGAGLYRNVHLVLNEKVHVPVWGTQVTTPHVGQDYASVNLKTTIANDEGKPLTLTTSIYSPEGKEVAVKKQTLPIFHNKPFEQNFLVQNPKLWTPESPSLYKAVTKISVDGKEVDEYATTFGIRSIEVVPDKGFLLNGKLRKFQGVCNHHDLGPLGSAINKAALRRQLTLLKDMGCDAVRTSHNMPTPELVELCDEMGFMMMLEPFDEWDIAKCDSGYHRFFNEWAERDMVNMLRHYRNHPSVVMWSIGNEVPTQWSPEGYRVATFLQDICHREDPTRPCTSGMDQVDNVLNNGFAAMLDIPGFNYRTKRYVEGYNRLPQNLLLGSETASTVSSRGVYKFPADQLRAGAMYDDHQSTGYGLESCWWSNVPDEDFALAEDYPWTMGQFVWTGFDYLGEPSPYDTDAWPSHSSLFGIIDLASLPKDDYYLYRSVWNKDAKTLHVLPHWTWKGREGEVTPVFVYTSYPEAELFVNGKSQGRQRKLSAAESEALKGVDSLWQQRRYRLMWMDVKYEPGEIKVVAYDKNGKEAATEVVRTAGKPHHIELVADRTDLSADGNDLAYVTVKVVDKDGNLCPDDGRLVSFTVKGSGKFRAAANGDATNLDLFHLPKHHAFKGMLTAIVQAGESAGTIQLEAKAPGLKAGTVLLHAK